MDIAVVVAAVLLLQPVLVEETDMRLVARGVDDEPVTWRLGEDVVAVTQDREVAQVSLPAGRHTLWVESWADDWIAMARPDPVPEEGAAWVPSWTARSTPPAGPAHGPTPWYLPGALLAALGAAALAFRAKQP